MQGKSKRDGNPLPDTESVRQAALAASWRRDRVVARRRLAWRWFLWYLWRSLPYLLAACALVAAGSHLWRASAAAPEPAPTAATSR